MKTGRLLPEKITRTQYAGPTWREDNRSFYYARLQELPPHAPPAAIYENEKVFLHVLGRDPEKDVAIFGPGVSKAVSVSKAGFTFVSVAPGSRFAISFQSAGTTDPGNVYVAPLSMAGDARAPWRLIVRPEDQLLTISDSSATLHDSTLYLIVTKDAPNGRLLALDLDHPDLATAKVLVPPSDTVLEGVYAARDALYVKSRTGVRGALRRLPYEPGASWETVPLPYDGTIFGVDASVLLRGVLFDLESWTRSGQAMLYEPASGRTTNTGLIPEDPADFSRVEAREVEAVSEDGTRVPLSILYEKEITLDGSHPALFYGYGSYGVSIKPFFDPELLAWIEHGGVYAIAHVRGGGEFGERWHNEGRKATKQHTIDDMVAAARYLIDDRYTSSRLLGVMGTSAGGIAVGGAIVQHPELFAVAIDDVGVTDLLRFQGTPGGAANVPEFGDVGQASDFSFLFAVSPYHHVTDGTRYPAVLGVTGTNDPRVPPWMVAKMIARLQAATSSDRPVLLRVDFDAGHGLGSSRTQRERLLADEMSFALWQMGDPDFQPKK